jgi:hypothetical protein
MKAELRQAFDVIRSFYAKNKAPGSASTRSRVP